MGSTSQNLHILFFPFMAQGHMLPMVDMAKVFAARGVAVTILTTPRNSSSIRPTIDRFNSSSADNSPNPIHFYLIPFPSAAAGLPDGVEDFSLIFKNAQLLTNFVKAIEMLSNSFDDVVKDLRPDCVVTDAFLPGTQDIATQNGIPRIAFNGASFFAQCAVDSMDRYQPLENLPPEANTLFALPAFPHHIELLRSQIRDPNKVSPSILPVMEFFKHAKELSLKSYGMVVNSFYELEPDYVEQFRKVVGLKAWHVGPVALCNQEGVDKLVRGGGGNREECLQWLDGRKPGSVLYVCFGSVGEFMAAQLREMAFGLEASGHPFIWVVRSMSEDEWIPEGYEERIEGRGVMIRGWVPQLSILNHESVGGFVTHCGWNSSLEGICAGLPMATWPLFAEQFFNERLLVDVLKIGVAVGSKVHGARPEDRPVVEATALEEAVRRLMGEGEEPEERRRRARELKEMARKAVEEGGSSYNHIGSLIQELRERKT